MNWHNRQKAEIIVPCRRIFVRVRVCVCECVVVVVVVCVCFPQLIGSLLGVFA